MAYNITQKTSKKSKVASVLKDYYNNRQIFLLLLPCLVSILIFKYLPIYGVTVAFKEYRLLDGIIGSPWVGLENFKRMFSATNDFRRIFFNTIEISFIRILFAFPAPIALALLLNEIKNRHYKKIVQTVTYLPHFLSWVILAGIFQLFLSPSTGIVNTVLVSIGIEPIHFLADIHWFRPILVATDIWKTIGWSSIIFLAAITNINPELYEQAYIDGASKIRQVIHITIPSIMSVIVIMFIMRIGKIMDAGFDQIFNFYNPVVYRVADIIDTYVYRVGLVEMDYSFSTAVGLFKNVIGLVLVVITNRFAKAVGEYGLW